MFIVIININFGLKFQSFNTHDNDHFNKKLFPSLDSFQVIFIITGLLLTGRFHYRFSSFYKIANL